MPPYLLFANDNSMPDPPQGEFVVEKYVQQSTSKNKNRNSTPDLRQRGLVGSVNANRPSIAAQANAQRQEKQNKNRQRHLSTPGPKQRGLVGEYNHFDLNVLLYRPTQTRSEGQS